MEEKKLVLLNEDYLMSKIYTIREVQVMLDADLAAIYGYTTKTFNQQVKNNIEKFDDDFRFQLTKKEYEDFLKSKISTSKVPSTTYESIECHNRLSLRSNFLTSNTSKKGGRQYLPYVFTEQGIYMLMTVLKGELAVNQSKKLIRLFKKMKDFIIQLQNVLPSSELQFLALQTHNNTEDIRQLKQQMVTRDELSVVIKDFTDSSIKKDYLFYNGQTVEADIAYSEIYSYAEKTIYIIDNYISLKSLAFLKSVAIGVKITIFSDNINHGLHQTEFNDFKKEYSNVSIALKAAGGIYHDRYIFIDQSTKNEKIYHCGGSSKDGGKRVTSISRVEDTMLYRNIINNLRNNPPLQL